MTSLVGAIPAGFGIYVMTMVFIDSSENASGLMLAAVGLVWLVSLILVCMPILIALFVPGAAAGPAPARAAKQPAKPKAKESAAAAADLDEFGDDDEFDDVDGLDDDDDFDDFDDF